jgi:hypothetical protein
MRRLTVSFLELSKRTRIEWHALEIETLSQSRCECSLTMSKGWLWQIMLLEEFDHKLAISWCTAPFEGKQPSQKCKGTLDFQRRFKDE